LILDFGVFEESDYVLMVCLAQLMNIGGGSAVIHVMLEIR
jgi:hypothetical protein